MLAAGTPRSFFFRGPTRDYATSPNQGGSATGCGIPDLTSDSSPFQNIAKAVAINIVAVGPAGAGDLRAWAANHSLPLASVLNYAAVAGLNIANGVIVPMCDEVSATPCAGGDITFQPDVSGTQLVVDVVGYFHAGSTAETIWNTALGHLALPSNTTGLFNTANGPAALRSNTGGNDNTANGAFALYANAIGSRNTASGVNALFSNTTGSYNTAGGVNALQNNSTGYKNTASGFGALKYNNGNFNSASGYYALRNNSTGSKNTAIGAEALPANVVGTGNTAIGYQALFHTTGSYNVGVGLSAGTNALSGTGNVFISSLGNGGDSFTIRIGGPQSRTFIAGIRGATTGNSDAIPVLIDSSGQLGTTSSSLRFKQDIEDVGEASERILSLRPVRFRYKTQAARGDMTPQFGLIAEEVAEVFPELVVYDQEGQPETVKYHLLVPLLLGEAERQQKAMQEERRETRDHLEAQQAEITALKEQVDRLVQLVKSQREEAKPSP